MHIAQYAVLAARTLNSFNDRKKDLAHMAMGVSGEAGEILDLIKKHFAYDKELDYNHLVEEMGDLLFYINGMILIAGTSWEEVMAKNIAKLEARYPEAKFDADKAINRDKDAEKEAMNQIGGCVAA